MRQKGFGLIPVLLILLLTGAITASGYLYFFSKEEDRNPNSYQPALNSETPLPSPTISPAAMNQDDLTLEEIKKLEPNIAWGEATESIITDFYAEEKPKGKVMQGTYIGEDIDSFRTKAFLVAKNNEYWTEKGWKDDIAQAADGANGSSWGYYQDNLSGRRILNFREEMSATDAERMFQSRDTSTEFKCPCRYEVQVFLSDWFPYNAE